MNCDLATGLRLILPLLARAATVDLLGRVVTVGFFGRELLFLTVEMVDDFAGLVETVFDRADVREDVLRDDDRTDDRCAL